MASKMVPMALEIVRETEKAVRVITQHGEAENTTHYMWIPKSCCELQTYVATVDYQDNPLEYGTRVIGVAEWFAKKNKM